MSQPVSQNGEIKRGQEKALYKIRTLIWSVAKATGNELLTVWEICG